jgi:hypothetical protein
MLKLLTIPATPRWFGSGQFISRTENDKRRPNDSDNGTVAAVAVTHRSWLAADKPDDLHIDLHKDKKQGPAETASP